MFLLSNFGSKVGTSVATMKGIHLCIVMIFCVWNNSGLVSITIAVVQILIFNAYLFVMDIK